MYRHTPEAAPEAAPPTAGQPSGAEQPQPQQGGSAASGEGEESEEWEEESWAARQARLRAYRVPDDPQPPGRWELAATTMEEFEVGWGLLSVFRAWHWGTVGYSRCVCYEWGNTRAPTHPPTAAAACTLPLPPRRRTLPPALPPRTTRRKSSLRG